MKDAIFEACCGYMGSGGSRVVKRKDLEEEFHKSCAAVIEEKLRRWKGRLKRA